MTFKQYINSFPPILCRLLAMEKNKPLTHAQIAERSGHMPDICNLLSVVEVVTFSDQTHWKGIGLLEALAFMRGCGTDFTNPKHTRRVLNYLRHEPNFDYLRKSPEWKSYYQPLIVKWRMWLGPNVRQPENLHPYIHNLAKRLTPLCK